MKRLQFFVLTGIFLLCTGAFNAVYCNTNEVTDDNSEITSQYDEEEMYSHGSVLPDDDLNSEYEEPKTDAVITDDDETEDGNEEDELTEDGEEV